MVPRSMTAFTSSVGSAHIYILCYSALRHYENTFLVNSECDRVERLDQSFAFRSFIFLTRSTIWSALSCFPRNLRSPSTRKIFGVAYTS